MIEGAGTVGVEFSPSGFAVADNSRIPRLFKIVSGSNPYTANEVCLNESDGSRAVTDVYDVTAAQKVLWEVNGNTSVPADTVVMATPNPAGTGFYFSSPAASLPPYRRPVAFCVVKSGGNVTGLKVTWKEADGSLTCETVPDCTDGDCNSVWYCVDGVATSVAVASAPPAGTVVVGPFDSQAHAEETCPAASAPACDSVPSTLAYTVSGGGCADGATGTVTGGPATWVSGGGAPPCGGDGPFLALTCSGGTWTLAMWSGACSGIALTSWTATSLTFVTADGCVFGGGPMTITFAW